MSFNPKRFSEPTPLLDSGERRNTMMDKVITGQQTDELGYPIQLKTKQLLDSGERRQFESGAVRDAEEGKGRCDLLPACAILRLARHYEAGAIKYEDRNWEKGMPISVMMDSAMRHMLKYLNGDTDEDHLVAAAWNIMGAMWMEEKKPEMQDLPSRIKHVL